MAVTKWDPGTNIQMPSVSGASVAASLANASDAFGDINRGIREQEAVDSRNAYRQEQSLLAREEQNWKRGAPERKILEEQRVRAQSNERAILSDQVASEAGGSLAPEFFSSPDVKKMLEGQDFNQDEFVTKNRALFSDPKAYRKTIRSGMLSEGFTGPEADDVANRRTAEMFPTLDPAIATKLFAKPGSGGGASGSSLGAGGTGTQKLFSTDINQAQVNDQVEGFVESMGISKGRPVTVGGKRIFDPGDLDATSQDIHRMVSRLREHGISPAATLDILRQDLDEDNDLKYDPRKLTNKEIEKRFIPRAKVLMGQQRETFNSKTGLGSLDPLSAALAVQNNQAEITRNYNQDILGRMSPQVATRDQRLGALRAALGFPTEEVAPAAAPAPILGDAQPAPAPAPQAGPIMPGAAAAPAQEIALPKDAPQPVAQMIGEGVRSGLEINKTTVDMITWLNQQTGQGIIDIVKSFKNAPEWLAQFQQGYTQ